MRLIHVLGALCALAATGCSTAPAQAPLPERLPRIAMPVLTPAEARASGVRDMTPVDAVLAAADAAGDGVPGVYSLTIARAEYVGPRLYLNSEADYRDQRNLSVVVHRRAQRGLRALLGTAAPRALLGRPVRLFGYARRVRINFIANGRATGKYYYQTHVALFDARQIELL